MTGGLAEGALVCEEVRGGRQEPPYGQGGRARPRPRELDGLRGLRQQLELRVGLGGGGDLGEEVWLGRAMVDTCI